MSLWEGGETGRVDETLCDKRKQKLEWSRCTSWTTEHWQPPREARQRHGRTDLLSFQGTVLATPRFQTSTFQSCEATIFCFKPPSLCYFIKAALGNEYIVHQNIFVTPALCHNYKISEAVLSNLMSSASASLSMFSNSAICSINISYCIIRSLPRSGFIYFELLNTMVCRKSLHSTWSQK